MVGSATLTIATSSTTMNCAATITANANQRRRSRWLSVIECRGACISNSFSVVWFEKAARCRAGGGYGIPAVAAVASSRMRAAAGAR
jgi:hypothetical protein